MSNERRKELVHVSDSLSGILAQMSPDQQDAVADGLEFYIHQYRSLKEENDSVSVAAAIHSAVDNAVTEQIAADTEHTPTCGKACSFCCFLSVDVSIDEAELLVTHAEEKNIDIDYERLEKQAETKGDDYLKLNAKDRKCVFLTPFAVCGVYEHRPSSCRKLNVMTDPELCDTVNNLGAEVGRMVSIDAEIMTSASMNAIESGTMAEMILKYKNGKRD